MKNLFKRAAAGLVALATVAAGVGLGASPALAVTTYHYAIGEQTGIVADGAAVNLTIESPYMSSAHDGASAHSLAELTVRSADLKDRIEVGWRKPTVSATALFVYHTVNGVPMGYNLCTDYAAEPFNAGDVIPAALYGTNPRFQIIHSGTAWWVAFNLKWVCHFPDTIWTSAGRTFTKVNTMQAYGEVASTTSATPCSDMGDGQPASSGTAARIGSLSYQGQTSGPAAAFTVYTLPNTAGITTSVVTSTTFRYGWEGYTNANTLPGNTGSC
jgi:hypothetical protein